MTPNLPTPKVTAAIPARAVGMAATDNKRDAQIGRIRSFRCWDLGWHKWACSFSRFFFRFWNGFLSDFAYFDAKTTGKPHDITIEHIKHARQCVFGA
jgi:hypothetical protein